MGIVPGGYVDDGSVSDADVWLCCHGCIGDIYIGM